MKKHIRDLIQRNRSQNRTPQPRCLACSLPPEKVTGLNRELVTGFPAVTVLARRTGISHASLLRHRQNHLSAATVERRSGNAQIMHSL